MNINGHDLLFVGAEPECFEGSSILEDFSDSIQAYGRTESSRDSVERDPGFQSEVCDVETTPVESVSVGSRALVEGAPSRDIGVPSDITALEYSRVLSSFENCYPIGSDLEIREYDLETVELPGNWPIPPVLGGDEGAPESHSPLVREDGVSPEAAMNEEVPAALRRFQHFAHVMASQENSGVVFVPQAASFDELISTLENQLPWCH